MDDKKQRIMAMYGVEDGAAPESLESFLERLGSGPAYNYAVSSVERNMFEASWAAQAIRAGLYDRAWDTWIRPRVAARLVQTPFTRYSGD